MMVVLADATSDTGEFVIQPREMVQLIEMSPLQLVCHTSD